jgi:hypothetical protein
VRAVFARRLKSPLRWLSAVMTSLMIAAVSSILQTPWLLLTIPVVAGLFLLAPPIGVYRHDETPAPTTGVELQAIEAPETAALTESRFRLVLVNHGAVAAEDIRIRLLVPHSVVPPEVRSHLLGHVQVGSFGTHWFVDSALDATAITFRTAPRGTAEVVTFPAGSSHELADLILPGQARPIDVVLDYQVSGASVKPSLDRLRLKSARSEREKE